MKEDTINKSLLLNWLYMAPKDISLKELGQLIASKTEGKYRLIKYEPTMQEFLEDEYLKDYSDMVIKIKQENPSMSPSELIEEIRKLD